MRKKEAERHLIELRAKGLELREIATAIGLTPSQAGAMAARLIAEGKLPSKWAKLHQEHDQLSKSDQQIVSLGEDDLSITEIAKRANMKYSYVYSRIRWLVSCGLMQKPRRKSRRRL